MMNNNTYFGYYNNNNCTHFLYQNPGFIMINFIEVRAATFMYGYINGTCLLKKEFGNPFG